MDSGDVWRGKTDEQVLEAHARLPDYTDEGQQVLRMEVERRHLDVSAVPAAPDVSVASAEPNPPPGQPIARLWAGGYSLPLTYWGWGVGGSLAGLVAIALVNTVPAAGPAFGMAAALLSFMYLIYLVIVAVGIWRSADRYKGKPMWAALAKAAVAAQAAGLVMRITYAVFGPAR